MGQPASVDVDDMIRQRADEIDVVADEDEGAFELVERVGQRIDARQVQVRGRLVHEQQVRRVQEQFHQRQAALLAAAQHLDLLEHIVAAKEETAEQGADELLGQALRGIERLLEHGAVQVQHVHAILRVVAGLGVVAERALARLRREHAPENLQQRGFARPVRPHQHDALAALRLETHAAVHHAFAVGKVDVLQLDRPEPAALRLGEPEIQLAVVALGRFDLVHTLNLLELALGLCRLGILGAEAVDEFHQAADFPLLVFVEGQLLLLVGLALQEILVIAAAVTDQLALANLNNASHKLVQELAVMRDDENRSGVALQIVLKPQQRLQVKMVGRLVQQQQVRLLRQQSGQVRPHHPAAAHLARGPVGILVAEAEAGEDLPGLGFETIAPQLVEPVMHVIMDLLRVRRLYRVVGLPRFENAAQLRVFGRDAGRQFYDGFVCHRGIFLRQVTDGDAAFGGDGARVSGFLAQDDREQSRLPGPVRADEPNPVLAVYLQQCIREQHPFAVRLADAGQS